MRRADCLWIALLLLAAALWAQAPPARRLAVDRPLELAWTRTPGCYGVVTFHLEVRSDGRQASYRARLRARRSFLSDDSRTEVVEGGLTGRELAELLQALDRPETWRETPAGVIGGASWSLQVGDLCIREVDSRVARRVETETVAGELESRLRTKLGLDPRPGPD